ncbi:MAG: hypothetical protein ACFB9M_20170 [Myxococcota bacterium]
MATTLFDPVSLLKVLLADGSLSSSLAPQMRKPALKAFEQALKAKAFGLSELSRIRSELGDRQFALVVDAIQDTSLRAAVKRFDPHHPNAAVAAGKIDAAWAREHLMALAKGRAKPSEKPKPLDKLLATKDRTPEKLAALAQKLGPEIFLRSLSAMSKTASCGFAKKVDPKHPKAKRKATEIDPEWARSHIAELAGLSLPEDDSKPEDGAEWFARLRRVYATKA